jgi:hypothetical protein
MIIPLLFTVLASLTGIAAVTACRVFTEKMITTLIGVIGGLTLATTLLYLTTFLWPLGAVSMLVVAAIMVALLLVLVYIRHIWPDWWQLPTDYVALTILLFTLALFSLIAPKLLIETPNGLYTGIINAYGDVAWHTSIITMFAEGGYGPLPENPIFAGTRLIYPFLADFLSAGFLVSGLTLVQSIVWPALFLIPLLLTLLYCFVRELTHSRLAGVIAMLLFLFGGATFGFVRFTGDWQASGQTLPEFLLHLPNRDYSGVGTDTEGFHFLNPVSSLLLPQRNFLFGIPLALSILSLLIVGNSQAPEQRKWTYALAGLFSGLLPLFHAHTVLALAVTIMALVSLHRHKQWLVFIVIAGVIGLPEVLYHVSDLSNSDGSFFRVAPGWMAGERNWLIYWLQNTGLLLPLTLVGLVLPAPRVVKALAVAGLLIFVATNIWLFAPWAWDNFKLIIFWLILSLPLISWLMMYAIRASQLKIAQAAVFLLLGLHLLSAGLDIWKLALPTATEWQEWPPAAIQAAQMIQAATQPGERIVTAPIHNSPVALAGRLSYLGLAAHVWSHGKIPWVREQALEHFYRGQIQTLPEVSVTYVLVGPDERIKYQPVTPHPTWQLVASEGSYQLYKISR